MSAQPDLTILEKFIQHCFDEKYSVAHLQPTDTVLALPFDSLDFIRFNVALDTAYGVSAFEGSEPLSLGALELRLVRSRQPVSGE